MKKSIFILFILLCPVFCTQVWGNVAAVADSTGGREIRIKESTTPSSILRSAPAPAVSAWLSDAQIDLTFLRNLGDVTITVANTQETVYSATVTAGEGTQTVIYTEGWSAGDYTITIVRSNGQSFTGDFEL